MDDRKKLLGLLAALVTAVGVFALSIVSSAPANATVTAGRYCDPYGALGSNGEDNFTLCFTVEPFGPVGANQAFIVDGTSNVTAAPNFVDPSYRQWFHAWDNGSNTLTTYGGAFASGDSRGFTGPWTIGQGGYVRVCATDNDGNAFVLWYNPNGTTTTGGSSPKWNFADGHSVC